MVIKMNKKEKRGILGLGILPIGEDNTEDEIDTKAENEGNKEENEIKDTEVPIKEEDAVQEEEPTKEVEEEKPEEKPEPVKETEKEPKPPEVKIITTESDFKISMVNMGWSYKEYTPETAPPHLGLKEKGMFEGYDKIFITEVDTLDIITVLNLSRTNFSYISGYVLGYKA